MREKVSIALAGCQWISHYLLRKLCDSGYKPSLLISAPEKDADKISGYFDLSESARDAGVEFYRAAEFGLKSQEDKNFLGSVKIDILLVFGWPRLIPEWLIDSCKYGVYGVHGGPEKPPRCRGRAVFNWALIKGCKKFYMYMFRIDAGVDSGDIIEMRSFDITPFDDILSLYHKNCLVSSDMFIKNIPGIISGDIESLPQTGEPSFLPGRKPEHGGIDWTQKAEDIANLVRALAPPYPGAFTFLGNMKISIFRAHIFDTQIKFDSEPGQIIEVFPNGDFLVMTGDYPLYVRDCECSDPDKIVAASRLQVKTGEQPPIPEF